MSTPSQTPAQRTAAISGGVLVGLAGLVVVLVLGLVYLTGAEGRDATFAWLSSVGALIASTIAGIGVVQNRQLGRQLGATTETVDKVQHQTNGALDARIEAATSRAVATALEAAGVTDTTQTEQS